MLTKEQILAKREAELIAIDVPEWGGPVRLSKPTAKQLEEFERDQAKRRAAGNAQVGFRARVAILMCANPDGSKMFTASDEAALSDQPAKALTRIHEAAAPLLGWTEESVEERAKNLQTTTGDDSTTD